MHPAHFERDEGAECSSRVDVRSAGTIEPAADFGEAQRHGEGRDAHQHETDRTPRADLRRDLRGHEEDRAADHLIHADRREIPAAERAPERRHVKAVVS